MGTHIQRRRDPKHKVQHLVLGGGYKSRANNTEMEVMEGLRLRLKASLADFTLEEDGAGGVHGEDRRLAFQSILVREKL